MFLLASCQPEVLPKLLFADSALQKGLMLLDCKCCLRGPASRLIFSQQWLVVTACDHHSLCTPECPQQLL